jgi:hypothetical protein
MLINQRKDGIKNQRYRFDWLMHIKKGLLFKIKGKICNLSLFQ